MLSSKRSITGLWVVAAMLLSLCTVRADEWDKKTVVTFSQPVSVPGMVLPAGQYVFKLANLSSDRKIVYIFSDQNRLLTTIFAASARRLERTGDPVLKFWETPAGVPVALRTWYYAGERDGITFAPMENSVQ